MKKLSVITLKILTIVVGASILLCTALFFVGFYQFDRQFDRQYRTTMISIAKTARDSLNADLFPKYLETSLPDGSWYAVHDILQRLVNDFELNLMYVSYVEPPDYNKIHYIYNPVRTGSKYKEARPASVRAEWLGGKDGEVGSMGGYVTTSIPVVDALDIVASGETFDRNTKVDGWDQTNLTIGLQYWFYKKCRLQLQYTRCLCGENISSKDYNWVQAQVQVAF
jgi:hypothetical protein